ncbi:MAG: beta-propeller fold lactonase family protein [Planctomycetota bacterium]|nr:beta-propeller fold lactonase family protein [Planctomycetota bacterium]
MNACQSRLVVAGFSSLALVAAASAVGRSFSPAPAASADAAPLVKETWLAPRPVARDAEAGRPGPLAADPTHEYISANQEPEGDVPRNVVFTPDGSEVLIVHRDTDNVTFFDVPTRTATHTVDAGDFPVDVAVTPDGQYAVVPNVLDNSVTIIDVPTHSALATVPVTGEQPYAVAVTSDSQLAVVGVINDAVNSSFSVIDLVAQSEVLTFPSGSQGVIGFWWAPESGTAGNIFTRFALTPDGGTIVLPDRGGARVRLYDRMTGDEVADLPVAAQPTAVDVSADGTTAVVNHEGDIRTITEVDLVNQVVSGTANTDENLRNQAIRITPDKNYAIAAISNNVIFVNLETGVTTATVSTGVVGEIEISHDGQYAFVSNYNARVIDIASQSLVKTIPFAACVEAAASPVESRAVALNNRFREDIHFYNIDGASGFFEGFASSGEPEEGDATYGVDIAPDGTVAVACNVVSRNATVFDLTTNTVRSYIEIGDRGKEVRITPDGRYAVACAMDANAVAIVDLTTDTVVKSLTINERPGRVRISPDGQEAYVLNVAGSDRITFIALDGADSFIITQLPAGQTGSANGPTYTETSGIELSPDGSILAVCDSFNDKLRLYDTAAREQVAEVGVGDFPLRVAFSPDGTRAYVTNHFSNSLSVINVDGENSSLITTIPGCTGYPLTVSVDGAGEYVYVGTNTGSNGTNAIRVIDAASNTLIKTILTGDGYPRDSYLSPDTATLYVSSTDSELIRIDAAGSDSSIIDRVALTSGPCDLAFNEARQTAITTQPVPDGIDVVSCRRPGDVDGDGDVDTADLLALLATWGDCPDPPEDCPADFDGDGDVDTADLLTLLANWG